MFSGDIRLEDTIGETTTFANDVQITGWTSVGDKKSSAYVGKHNYMCILELG